MNFNWTDLDNTLDVVEQLRNTGSTKEKGNILKANVNDETLQKVLTYTLIVLANTVSQRKYIMIFLFALMQRFIKHHMKCLMN